MIDVPWFPNWGTKPFTHNHALVHLETVFFANTIQNYQKC